MSKRLGGFDTRAICRHCRQIRQEGRVTRIRDIVASRLARPITVPRLRDRDNASALVYAEPGANSRSTAKCGPRCGSEKDFLKVTTRSRPDDLHRQVGRCHQNDFRGDTFVVGVVFLFPNLARNDHSGRRYSGIADRDLFRCARDFAQ